MPIRRKFLTGVILFAVALSSAHAAEPVYRLSSSCDMPTMPGKGSTKQDWDTYAALVRDYNECLAAKAAKYGKKTKEALEGVGDTVTGWSESASGWFKK